MLIIVKFCLPSNFTPAVILSPIEDQQSLIILFRYFYKCMADCVGTLLVYYNQFAQNRVCVSVYPHGQANFQYAENKPLCDKKAIYE